MICDEDYLTKKSGNSKNQSPTCANFTNEMLNSRLNTVERTAGNTEFDDKNLLINESKFGNSKISTANLRGESIEPRKMGDNKVEEQPNKFLKK
jgi:hypothetical protein